jgi:hypothetical protein
MKTMTTFKTIRTAAAACSLTLLAASLVHAQGSTTTTGSTDIYNTDFQKTFATASVVHQKALATASTGSTDIYTTNFQKTFATDQSVHQTPDAAHYRGPTDFWSTNFQKAFM